VRPELKENETRTWNLMQKMQEVASPLLSKVCILMICINNENVDCLDLDKVVDELLSRKKRRICQ
jgi:hypothetical protein